MKGVNEHSTHSRDGGKGEDKTRRSPTSFTNTLAVGAARLFAKSLPKCNIAKSDGSGFKSHEPKHTDSVKSNSPQKHLQDTTERDLIYRDVSNSPEADYQTCEEEESGISITGNNRNVSPVSSRNRQRSEANNQEIDLLKFRETPINSTQKLDKTAPNKAKCETGRSSTPKGIDTPHHKKKSTGNFSFKKAPANVKTLKNQGTVRHKDLHTGLNDRPNTLSGRNNSRNKNKSNVIKVQKDPASEMFEKDSCKTSLNSSLCDIGKLQRQRHKTRHGFITNITGGPYQSKSFTYSPKRSDLNDTLKNDRVLNDDWDVDYYDLTAALKDQALGSKSSPTTVVDILRDETEATKETSNPGKSGLYCSESTPCTTIVTETPSHLRVKYSCDSSDTDSVCSSGNARVRGSRGRGRGYQQRNMAQGYSRPGYCRNPRPLLDIHMDYKLSQEEMPPTPNLSDEASLANRTLDYSMNSSFGNESNSCFATPSFPSQYGPPRSDHNFPGKLMQMKHSSVSPANYRELYPAHTPTESRSHTPEQLFHRYPNSDPVHRSRLFSERQRSFDNGRNQDIGSHQRQRYPDSGQWGSLPYHVGPPPGFRQRFESPDLYGYAYRPPPPGPPYQLQIEMSTSHYNMAMKNQHSSMTSVCSSISLATSKPFEEEQVNESKETVCPTETQGAMSETHSAEQFASIACMNAGPEMRGDQGGEEEKSASRAGVNRGRGLKRLCSPPRTGGLQQKRPEIDGKEMEHKQSTGMSDQFSYASLPAKESQSVSLDGDNLQDHSEQGESLSSTTSSKDKHYDEGYNYSTHKISPGWLTPSPKVQSKESKQTMIPSDNVACRSLNLSQGQHTAMKRQSMDKDTREFVDRSPPVNDRVTDEEYSNMTEEEMDMFKREIHGGQGFAIATPPSKILSPKDREGSDYKMKSQFLEDTIKKSTFQGKDTGTFLGETSESVANIQKAGQESSTPLALDYNRNLVRTVPDTSDASRSESGVPFAQKTCTVTSAQHLESTLVPYYADNTSDKSSPYISMGNNDTFSKVHGKCIESAEKESSITTTPIIAKESSIEKNFSSNLFKAKVGETKSQLTKCFALENQYLEFMGRGSDFNANVEDTSSGSLYNNMQSSHTPRATMSHPDNSQEVPKSGPSTVVADAREKTQQLINDIRNKKMSRETGVESHRPEDGGQDNKGNPTKYVIPQRRASMSPEANEATTTSLGSDSKRGGVNSYPKSEVQTRQIDCTTREELFQRQQESQLSTPQGPPSGYEASESDNDERNSSASKTIKEVKFKVKSIRPKQRLSLAGNLGNVLKKKKEDGHESSSGGDVDWFEMKRIKDRKVKSDSKVEKVMRRITDTKKEVVAPFWSSDRLSGLTDVRKSDPCGPMGVRSGYGGSYGDSTPPGTGQAFTSGFRGRKSKSASSGISSFSRLNNGNNIGQTGYSPDFIYRNNEKNKIAPVPRLFNNNLDSVQWQNWKGKFQETYRKVQSPFIDTHCHIDFLFERSGFRGTYSEYIAKNRDTFLSVYEGCVAIFCNPRTFSPDNALWKSLTMENGVHTAIGCHPKSATDFSPRYELAMKKMLEHPNVVALGEIGLDYSGTFHQHAEVQKYVLIKQCKLALEKNLPLVIHSRDSEKDITEVLADNIPRNYKIHRHCFTGNWTEAEEWLKKFPNSYIGLTPLITWYSAERAQAPREVARRIPLNKLLLETDAPYFVPKRIPREEMEYSHPGFAITVAYEVAKLKEMSIETVLQACRINTHDMYGI